MVRPVRGIRIFPYMASRNSGNLGVMQRYSSYTICDSPNSIPVDMLTMPFRLRSSNAYIYPLTVGLTTRLE